MILENRFKLRLMDDVMLSWTLGAATNVPHFLYRLVPLILCHSAAFLAFFL